MRFTLFTSDSLQDEYVVEYPHKQEVSDLESLKQACSKDYVCAEYRNNHRKNKNFIVSDCLPLDCDNSHSDDPKDWKVVDDVKKTFPNVAFAVHYSRNNFKSKDGKSPRPKFHILFPIDPMSDQLAYKELKKKILKRFPEFDAGAKDAARFFFGTEDPQVDLIEGEMYVDEFLVEESFELMYDSFIPEGHRNNSLLVAGDKAIIRFGDTERARERFNEAVAKCDPPLPQDEVEAVWKQCQSFFHEEVKDKEEYIDPALYNGELDYHPVLLTERGEAALLKREYGDLIRYCPNTGYLFFDGKCWVEDEMEIQLLDFKLNDLQVIDSQAKVRQARDALPEEALALSIRYSKKTALAKVLEEQKPSLEHYYRMAAYEQFVIDMQGRQKVENTIKLLKPMLKIRIEDMDQDAFLLNTPEATYDLRLGLNGKQDHDPMDFITKVTSVSPGDQGKEMWQDCLNTIFCGNQDLIDYVQEICGLAVIGKVLVEMLVIAYGDGANGKSTFWNTISNVLGDYSGRVSAETLTNSATHNVKSEMADLRGRRLAIAAEMGYGQSLNDAVVKQLCSTDEIYANPKYKDPYKFTPQQTVVLYTNNLPKVRGTDRGIWRRLVIIPFNAVIEGDADKKNYASDLYEKAGPAVLAWIIEGAKRIISKDYKLTPPAVVREATEDYRSSNDWLAPFIEECCMKEPEGEEKSLDLYTAYKKFCLENGEKPKSVNVFVKALKSSGYEHYKKYIDRHDVPYFRGLKLIPEDPTPMDDFEEEEEDYGF